MLEDARRLGFLGPGPVGAHVDHAEGFATAITTAGPASAVGRAVDLGSGGGVPGLALAFALPRCRWLLVDASSRRVAFLRGAVAGLQLGDQVTVVAARAEELGRNSVYRGGADVVVARGFGPPAVTAECAAPLLGVGGTAVVSEPPGGASARWSVEGLGQLGMGLGPAVRAGEGSFQVLVQRTLCPHRYPRRVGIPAKRPLF